jgi:hypothetical protein
MSDWKDIVQQKLTGMRIDGAHEGDIIDELSQYVEDRYEELRAAGVPEPEARRRALVETPPHTGTRISTILYDLRMLPLRQQPQNGLSIALRSAAIPSHC